MAFCIFDAKYIVDITQGVFWGRLIRDVYASDCKLWDYPDLVAESMA